MGMPEFTRKRRFSGGHSPRLRRTFWPPTGYRLFQKGHRHLPFTAKPLHFAHSPHRAFFGRNPTSFIVGYAQNELKAGFSAAGAQFVAISGEGIDLCDIIPTGYDKNTYVGGSITVQSLEANGYMVAGSMYYWYDDEDGTAWFDGNDEEVVRGQVNYGAGDAVWVNANSSSEALQSSGQVAEGSIDVYLRAGFKLVCNPTPVAVPFNDDNNNGKFIAPMGYDAGTYTGGSIYAQKLDKDGYTVAGSLYFWYDDEDGTAWFDGNDEEVSGVSLNPGEALWVNANSTTEKLSFPSAL